MITLIDATAVIKTHDKVLAKDGGLAGFAQGGRGALESALQRVENHILYGNADGIFEIAALYGVSIARGHLFNDGNKRTALACTLTYLRIQNIDITVSPELEDVMVEIAQGSKDYQWFAQYLASLVQPQPNK